MATYIGSGNGMLPDVAKPLPEPMLCPSVTFCGIYLQTISQKMLKASVTKISLIIWNYNRMS